MATLNSPSPTSPPRKEKEGADSKPGRWSSSITSGSLPASLKVDACSIVFTRVGISTTQSTSLPIYTERQIESSEVTLSSSARLPLASKFEEIDSTKPKRYVPLGVMEAELKSSSIVTKKREKGIKSGGREQSLSEFLPETPLPRRPATTTGDDTELHASFTQDTDPTAVHALTGRLQHALVMETQTSTPTVEVTPPTPTVTEPSPAKGGGLKFRKSPAKSVKHGTGVTGTREASTQRSVHRSATRVKKQSPTAAKVASGQVGNPRRADLTESAIPAASGSAVTTGRHHMVDKTKEDVCTHTTSRVTKPGSTVAKSASPRASAPKVSSPKACPPKAIYMQSCQTSPTETKTSPLRNKHRMATTQASQEETAHSTAGTRTTTEAHLHTSLQHRTPSVQPATVPIVFHQKGARERWLQLNFSIAQIYRNGAEVSVLVWPSVVLLVCRLQSHDGVYCRRSWPVTSYSFALHVPELLIKSFGLPAVPQNSPCEIFQCFSEWC